MTIGNYQELIQLSVTNLKNHDLFLGYDWLYHQLEEFFNKSSKLLTIVQKNIHSKGTGEGS